jgi:hypothetical protein
VVPGLLQFIAPRGAGPGLNVLARETPVALIGIETNTRRDCPCAKDKMAANGLINQSARMVSDIACTANQILPKGSNTRICICSSCLRTAYYGRVLLGLPRLFDSTMSHITLKHEEKHTHVPGQ